MARIKQRDTLTLLLAVLAFAVPTTPAWSAWGDIGDCSFHIVDGLRYHETWGQIGDDGGLWLSATEVGWNRKFVWGRATDGGFWLTPRPAREVNLEYFHNREPWERRLTQLGVKTPVKTRTIGDLRPWTCELSKIMNPLIYLGLLGVGWVLFGNPLPALLSVVFGGLLIGWRRRRSALKTSRQ